MSTVTAFAPAPVRPSYLRVLAGAAAGSLVVWLALSAVVAGAGSLGLIETRGTQGIVAGVLSHPFATNGPWSLAADVAIAFLLLAAMTAGVLAGLAAVGVRRVSWSRALLAVMLTGWAPFLGDRPFGGTFALFVVAWVVQRWGVERPPAFDLRRHAVAVAVALVLAASVPATYAEAHPLWTSVGMNVGAGAVSVSVHNVGFARLTVLAVDPPTPPRHLPRPPIAIPARGYGTIVLPWGCGTGYVATVRYRLLGRTLSAPLAVHVQNGRACGTGS